MIRIFAHTLIFLLMLNSAPCPAQQPPDIHWTLSGELPAKNGQPSLGVAGPVAGVHNGVLLVAGGANFPDGAPWLGGKKKYYTEGFVFRKNAAGSLQYLQPFSLPFAVGYTANCSTPDGVVAAGGENDAGLRKDVWRLQWDEAENSVHILPLPSLPFGVSNAALAYYQNRLYFAGGERAGDVSNELWRLDLSDTAAGWQQVSLLPKRVSHAVLVVQSNGKEDCLYLLGGRVRNPGGLSELYATVYEFDLKKEGWMVKKPLPYALSAGTGVAEGTQTILLFGGDTGETFHKTEALIAAIGKETNEALKQQLNKEKTAVQSTHPGFCRQVLLYNTKKNKWSPNGCLPFAAPATTTAVKWGEVVYLPSGEIKAGVRTPAIQMGQFLSPPQLKTEPQSR